MNFHPGILQYEFAFQAAIAFCICSHICQLNLHPGILQTEELVGTSIPTAGCSKLPVRRPLWVGVGVQRHAVIANHVRPPGKSADPVVSLVISFGHEQAGNEYIFREVKYRCKYTNFHTLTFTRCKTNNVIYLISCIKCGLQYVGQTTQALHNRLNGHLTNDRK